ncbi:MAG TPA: EamA family transporter [Oculatellaceae cyanobacterium]|jgi:drug/metabolite transporter (DMT)-like permease
MIAPLASDNRVSKAYLALFAVYVIWGTTFGSIKVGVDSIHWALLPMIRFSLAGLLLIAFCLLRGEKLPSWQDVKTNFIIGALIFFGGNSAVCWAVKHMTTGLGGLMVATTPFWMLWLSSILPPREKIPPAALVGLMIGFIGMLILLSPNLTHLESTDPLFWIGVLVMLGNTFSWSLGAIYARKRQTASSLLMNVGLQNLAAGLLLIPVCLLTVHDWSAIHPTQQSLVALAYLILVGSIAATPCYLYVLQTLPVSISSTFAYVTPVLTVIFGWLFLGEPMTPTIFAGSVVIVSGVLVVQWVNQRRLATEAKLTLKGASS